MYLRAPLNLDCIPAIRLEGAGAGQASYTYLTNGNTGSTIQYSGTGNSPFICARGTIALTTCGLSINYTSDSFTGVLIDLGVSRKCSKNGGAKSALIANCCIEGMRVAGAGTLVSLDSAIATTIRNNVFNYAQVGIRGLATPGSYSNAIQILNNFFANMVVSCIKNAGTAWLIQGNTFEDLVNGPAGGYTSDDGIDGTNSANGMAASFIGNWFGDANEQGAWITWEAQNPRGSNLLVLGNFFLAGDTGVAVTARESSGISITSNNFVGQQGVGVNLGTGHTNAVILGNKYFLNGPPVGGAPESSVTDGASNTLSGPLFLAAGSGAGAPTAGSHQVGELYVDSSGSVFVCVESGSPGGWKQMM